MKGEIVIENLRRRFGRFTAVDNLSFSVRPGEIFGFLGANGAGKTTTIRMICGLLKPSGGEITVNGFRVTREAEKIRKSIGYMSQKFSLYGDLTPAENIDFFGAVYGVPRQELKVATRRFLESLGSDLPRGFPSGRLPLGFKQRLGLACALLHDPGVVVLDEPTSGVDPLGRRQFWSGISALAGQGKTILVTTHFMDEAEYCDRMAIMNAGRLEVLDTPGAIREKYGAADLNEAFIRAVEG
jgi:ABC-2 type transport system ATP-binding protein